MKVKKFFFFAMLCSFFLSSVSAFGVWDVSPSETQYAYSPGDTFTVEIMISGDGKDVDAMGFDLHFPGDILDYVIYDYTGTLVEAWMFKQISNLSSGVLRIAGFTTTGIIVSGTSGILIKLDFMVKQGASGTGTIFVEGFTDDLAGATSQPATVTVGQAGFSVSGFVQYYNQDKPVENDTLTLDGSEAVTNAAGAYTFANVPGGTYTLNSSKSGDVGSSVSAYDASFILRYAVGLITFSPYQSIAADVSGNGSVSAYDASFILRKVVGLITQFPVGKEWRFVPSDFAIDATNWNAAPNSIDFAPLNADMVDQNFKAIVYGDVSGNWTALKTTGNSAAVEVVACTPKNLPENKLILPFEINLTETTFSGSAVLNFNRSDMEFISGALQSDRPEIIFECAEKSGQLALAFASSQALENETLKIDFLFEKLNSAQNFLPELKITEMAIDEKFAVIMAVNNFRATEMPVEYELLQNHPNPFNPETTIKFKLPNSTFVKIDIYNQLGQKVRTLLSQRKNAGIHEVIWNGYDDHGKQVGSGIYLYKMQADQFCTIKKMMLVR